ncbi:MAG: type I restriction endonuclease, partial [Bacteroidota bacterium]
MDFIDQLQALASKVAKAKDIVQTEEATKNAFVLPFIHALGYDVFNPLEVVPEFTADVGIKKGEKVDYAIFHDSKPIILFECKKCGGKLDHSCASQLYRYFSVTEARIGILTDGVIYQFFTDLEQLNKMDEKPFMEFNILDIQESLVPEIKKLTKGSFDLEATLNAASELKYTKEIRKALSEEFNSPSEDFVRHFTAKVYSGRLTQAVREQFT